MIWFFAHKIQYCYKYKRESHEKQTYDEKYWSKWCAGVDNNICLATEQMITSAKIIQYADKSNHLVNK